MAWSAVNKSLRRGVLSTLGLICRVFTIALLIGVLFFLLPVALPYLEGATSHRYIQQALAIDRSVQAFVKQHVPTVVAGKDVGRWMIVVVLFLLGGTFSRLHQRFRDRSEYLRFKMSYDEMKTRTHLGDNAAVFSPIKQKLDKMNVTRKKDREELLKLFAETKKKLNRMGRDLAPLAIDVVDSTGIKEGEERAVVEYDFHQYKRFVEGIFVTNRCIKSTWTPDGVMSCFPSVDTAVKAAREVIIALEAFNRHVKTMRRDFAVRCGINAGFVYFDESVPLEEVSDRVIDIAGHMQKHAAPNTACIAKPAIEPLRNREGFQAAGREVDGYEVYEWKPN
jgi:class 3 adenylate cyclase